jgi:alkylhydroperoxidase/carboxymuconolactone decarboxylase family protein YurZ
MDSLPHWALMERYDPELWGKLAPWREHLFERGPLPRKVKEIVLLAMCVQARFEPGVAIHAGLALDSGATPAELFDACSLSLLIGGVPAYREGVLTVQQVVDARSEGVSDEG